jgi:hypothetical protein
MRRMARSREKRILFMKIKGYIFKILIPDNVRYL